MRRGRVVEQRPDARRARPRREHPYTRLLLSSVPQPGWDLETVIRIRRELESTAT